MFFVSKSLEDTDRFASELLFSLKDSSHASVVGLTGELGAGKTTVVQSIARLLGVTERVTSPTYVIFKTYNLQPDIYNFKKLVHIDAYRLQDGKDLASLGWDTLIEELGTLITIEWPEKVAEILPSDIVNITIDPINKTTRNIEVTYGKENNT